MIPLSLVVMLRTQDNTQGDTQDNSFTEAGSYASPDWKLKTAGVEIVVCVVSVANLL